MFDFTDNLLKTMKVIEFFTLVMDKKRREQYKLILDMDRGEERAKKKNAFWNKWAEEHRVRPEEFEKEYFFEFKQRYEEYIKKGEEELYEELRRRFPEEFPEYDEKAKRIKFLFEFTKDVFYNDTDYERALDLVLQLIDKEKVESGELLPKVKDPARLKFTIYKICKEKLLFKGGFYSECFALLLMHFEDFAETTVANIKNNSTKDNWLYKKDFEDYLKVGK